LYDFIHEATFTHTSLSLCLGVHNFHPKQLPTFPLPTGARSEFYYNGMRNALRGNRAFLSRRGGQVAVASCESHALLSRGKVGEESL